MSTFIGVLLLVLVALIQVAVMPAFDVFGAHPNLLIVTLALVITLAGQRPALPLIAAGGLALSLLDVEPLGVTLLALTPLVPLSSIREWRLLQPELLLLVVLTGLATAAYEGILLVWLAADRSWLGWQASLLDILAPAIIANVLLSLPAYGLARLAVALSPAPQRAF